jgi:hypothetical protein
MSCEARRLRRRLSPLFPALLALALLLATLPLASPAATEERVFRLETSESGSPTFRVREGDFVTIEITSREAQDLHLHGYDLELHLEPGQRGQLRFEALHSGRFPAEAHGAGNEGALFYLEVLP